MCHCPFLYLLAQTLWAWLTIMPGGDHIKNISIINLSCTGLEHSDWLKMWTEPIRVLKNEHSKNLRKHFFIGSGPGLLHNLVSFVEPSLGSFWFYLILFWFYILVLFWFYFDSILVLFDNIFVLFDSISVLFDSILVLFGSFWFYLILFWFYCVRFVADVLAQSTKPLVQAFFEAECNVDNDDDDAAFSTSFWRYFSTSSLLRRDAASTTWHGLDAQMQVCNFSVFHW